MPQFSDPQIFRMKDRLTSRSPAARIADFLIYSLGACRDVCKKLIYWEKMVPRGGIEPPTRGFSAVPGGFEMIR
jgi:hypothetical protein